MLKTFKNFAVVLALMMTVASFVGTAEAVTSGRIGQGECIVTLTKGKTVKIQLDLKYSGKNANNSSVNVIMRDAYGNIIWQGNHKGGQLKLGNDHRVYRISIGFAGRQVGMPETWSISPVWLYKNNCTIE